ncbi:MAG: hypothetical protein HQ536_02700 [Parcubacteria group bacterium]|nr:hypothetical protein [Parcubacteria group bacterium]
MTLSILIVFIYGKLERSPGIIEGDEVVVNINSSDIVINYYKDSKLRVRFTKKLSESDHWPMKLFLPSQDEETGAAHNIYISANQNKQVSYIKIGDSFYLCSEPRNRRMCEDANGIFSAWSDGLEIGDLFQEALRSEEHVFDFGPYYPTDDCNP